VKLRGKKKRRDYHREVVEHRRRCGDEKGFFCLRDAGQEVAATETAAGSKGGFWNKGLSGSAFLR
jgi:hypothetical protein